VQNANYASLSAGEAIDLTLDDGRIVLAPVAQPARAGWGEAAKAIAAAAYDLPVWPEFGNADDESLIWRGDCPCVE